MEQSSTAKRLSYPVLLFILINSIIGSSLFYLPGLGVASSGAASIVAWVAVFIVALFVMIYLAELVTMHPTSGGTYEFCKRAYGRFGSFMAGWGIWITGNLGMALAIIAAAEYFIPDEAWQGFPIKRLIFTIIWIVVLNYLAYRSIDAGATMLVSFGVIALAVVSTLIISSFIDFPNLFHAGLSSPFNWELLQPFWRYEGTDIGKFLFLSMFLISEAFFGYEAISYLANEAKAPRKLHKVMITAIILSGIIMTLYVLSSLGIVNYHDYVQSARPWAAQALQTLGSNGQTILVFGMYLTIIGAAAAWPITGSRLIRAMANDKLFLKQMSVSHPKYNSPYRAVIFQGFMVFLFALMLIWGYRSGWNNSYRTVYLMYVLLGLLITSTVLLTVPILRHKERFQRRFFTAPLGRVGPWLIVGFLIFLVINWLRIEGAAARSIAIIASSVIIIGLPTYFLIEMLYDPKAIRKVNESSAYFAFLEEKILPYSIKKLIFSHIDEFEGKVVLQYGCSIGTLTKKIAGRVGKKGKVLGTELSLKKANMARKRTAHLPQVKIHHHPHLHKFSLKFDRKIDILISVGMLSVMQRPLVILTQMGKHLHKGAKIIMIDYDKFFHLIPNVTWVESDEKLKLMFKKAGFKVEVERKKGLLWQHLIIKGEKE